MSEREAEPRTCPFCGATAFEGSCSVDHLPGTAEAYSERRFYVTCNGCQANIPTKHSYEAAITAWNRRAETDALRAALERLAAEWEQFAADDKRNSKDPDFTRDERLEFEVRAQCYRGRVKNLREALAGTPAEDRYAAGRLAGLREAAAVALAYEQKCDAEAERHDWRKNDVASIPDAMRINEAWEERGESALVIRESIEALPASAPCVPLEHVRDIIAQTFRRAATAALNAGSPEIAAELERMAEGSA